MEFTGFGNKNYPVIRELQDSNPYIEPPDDLLQKLQEIPNNLPKSRQVSLVDTLGVVFYRSQNTINAALYNSNIPTYCRRVALVLSLSLILYNFVPKEAFAKYYQLVKNEVVRTIYPKKYYCKLSFDPDIERNILYFDTGISSINEKYMTNYILKNFFNENDLTMTSDKIPLDDILNSIKNSRTNIVIGFTDSTGTEIKNRILSEERATTVRSYLEYNGIPVKWSWGCGVKKALSNEPNDRPENRIVRILSW